MLSSFLRGRRSPGKTAIDITWSALEGARARPRMRDRRSWIGRLACRESPWTPQA